MRITSILISTVLAIGVAGCAQKDDEAEFAMRNAQGATAEHLVMQDQAQALTKMTREIVRKSTYNGAALGAVAGCGLAVLAPGAAKNCIGGVATGAAVGAVVGHAQGEKQVAKRMQLVSPSALVRSIGKTTDQVAQIEMTLPSLLAAQDIELAELSQKMTRGEITEETYAARADQIRADRSELAQALSVSAAQAHQAHENLKIAEARGQTGLDWHIHATKNLSRDVMSARSTIDLL